ncbi:MAG: hypothetical protein MUC84_08905 [Solirubrobacteraceae bacterium]|jgi:predicted lipoprotein with Yx(FWY)xxD motif|nr:hypothetical protein [Solirubrobacteraceae bacterium]
MIRIALRAPALALAGVALLVAAPASVPAAPIAAAPGAPEAGAARTGITITTRSVGRFGKILVDGRGMPLYVFTADKGRRSVCYGDCARAWPVTFAGGTPRARGGASDALLGTTKRRDGRRQVTYRGRPLYYYVDDRPGLALCHDVREFGGLWLLVRASGKRVP